MKLYTDASAIWLFLQMQDLASEHDLDLEAHSDNMLGLHYDNHTLFSSPSIAEMAAFIKGYDKLSKKDQWAPNMENRPDPRWPYLGKVQVITVVDDFDGILSFHGQIEPNQFVYGHCYRESDSGVRYYDLFRLIKRFDRYDEANRVAYNGALFVESIYIGSIATPQLIK